MDKLSYFQIIGDIPIRIIRLNCVIIKIVWEAGKLVIKAVRLVILEPYAKNVILTILGGMAIMAKHMTLAKYVILIIKFTLKGCV